MQNKKEITSEYKTRTNFFIQNQNSFHIILKHSFILGIKKCQFVIVLENLSEKNRKDHLLMFDPKSEKISQILFYESLNSIFVGYENGCLLHCDLNEGVSQLKILKNYENIGLDGIFTCAQIGHLAVFGGKNSKIVFIDMRSRKIIGEPIQTAYTYVFSLKFCKISNKKTLLSVVGMFPNYSDSRTDIFDVTQLLNYYRINV